jgi:hypothetical protein
MNLNSIGLIVLIICCISVIFLPKRFANISIIIPVFLLTRGQGLEIFDFKFTVLRIVIAIGFIRCILKGERVKGKELNSLDWSVVIFALWGTLSSFFHKDVNAAFIFRSGLAYDIIGVYFLSRIFITDENDLIWTWKVCILALIPAACGMIIEKFTRENLFSLMGGIALVPVIRENGIRAQGPFAHAILAGSVGGVYLINAIFLMKSNKLTGLLGAITCLTIVIASGSSGPILTLISGIIAISLFNHRQYLSGIRYAAILLYILLDVYMKDPAYFLVARIDLAGGSTGWHRAFLIHQAFNYIDEWWIAGTDYTRHWMPTGVSWSTEQSDITNHFLRMGVIGGIPLMILLIINLGIAFSYVGNAVKAKMELNNNNRLIRWILGATLFGHTITFLSVSYFDQSYALLYFNFAAISSLCNKSYWINKPVHKWKIV